MKSVIHLNGRTFQQYQSTSISIIASQMSYTTECITKLRTNYSSYFSFKTWDVHRQMSGSSFTASLGDIMLITIQKVVETPDTVLSAVQLGIQKSLQVST